MARLSQREYTKRLSRLGSSKSSIGTNAKSQCAGLFLALGILAGISAWYSSPDTLAQLTIGAIAIAFLILVFIINYINTGSVGIGFIWLFTILFAIKNLFEFEQFLDQKRSTKNL